MRCNLKNGQLICKRYVYSKRKKSEDDESVDTVERESSKSISSGKSSGTASNNLVC